MSEKRPSDELSDEELGALAEDFARKKDWAGVDELPDAEREARLVASGIDRKAARAIGERVHEKMEEARRRGGGGGGSSGAGAGAGAKVVSLDSRRRPLPKMLLLLPAAAAVALLATEGGTMVAWVKDTLDTSTKVAAGTVDEKGAAKWRARAAEDFAAGRYADCILHLDEARKLDPRGDGEPEPAALRRKAAEAMSGVEAGAEE